MSVPKSFLLQSRAVDTEELQEQISNAVDELPERCKKVFVLSRAEHLTNKEIAQKLNLSQRTR